MIVAVLATRWCLGVSHWLFRSLILKFNLILPSLEIDTADLIADHEVGTGVELDLEAGTSIEADLEAGTTGIEANLEVGTGTGIEANLEVETGTGIEVDLEAGTTGIEANLEVGTGIEADLEVGTSIEADLEVGTGIATDLKAGTGIATDLEAGTSIEADLEAEIVVPAGTDPGAQAGSIKTAFLLTRLMLPRFVKEQILGMKAAFGASRAIGHPTFWGCRTFHRLQRMESMRQSETLERANTFCESILFLI